MQERFSPVTDLELTRNSHQLRLLIEVSEAVARHRDLTALFRDLAGRLPAIVPFEFIALFLHDPEKNVMRVDTLGTSDADSIPPGLELPVDESYSGLVFTTQEPIIVNSTAEARFAISASLSQKIGAESFCVLPLTTTVRRIGAMGFGSSRRGAFDRSEVEYLTLVANQVAVAVDNVLHAESARATQARLSDERDRLRLLIEVSEAIASHRNLNDLFHDLAERLPRVVSFDYINLLLHDPAQDVMRLHILVAPERSTIRAGQEFPVHGSAAGFVWKTQQPLMVENLEAETRFPLTIPMLRENGIKSFCSLPVTTALRRLGALGFGSLTKRRYSDADQHFMQQVANQVAVAVDNVLHDESAQVAQQQLTRERDRLRLLLEVNNAVVSHLDLDHVFKAVSACVRRVIPCDGSSLLLWDAETGQYRVYVLRFRHNDDFVEEGRVTDPLRDRSPSGIAITTRQTTLFDEQQLRELADVSRAAARVLAEGVKSFCCVPLLSHDRVLGALNVGSFDAEAFSEDDVELLGQVAQQIAIAVENGLAYRQIAELKEKLKTEKLYLENEIRTEQNFDEIVGQSPPLRQVLEQIEIVAPTDSSVLIQGETGTGKELIARAIHNLSARRDRTFVKVNCAAIPTGLLESELFGHEKGAFTGAISQKIGRFELGNGGTLFLDEVGDIPLELQSKFLRVLQEQEFERLGSTRTIRVDIRLVAATNRDLTTMVEEKQFRSDLYYRLNVFPILSPPLRERQEDIAALVRHFTEKFSRKMNRRIESIPIDTMTTLTRYSWPGNIRELENIIERAVILSRGSTLDVPLAELKRHINDDRAAISQSQTTLEQAEREHIRQALEQANWLVGGPSGAAARLGMKRTTLQSKMAKLGIERPPSR